MDFTGERYCPGIKGEIALEHWQRYALARRLASGRDVLDVASGEGYGAALLAQVARTIVGIDLSQAAVANAKANYPAANLVYLCASASSLPLKSQSMDLVVSFETIEHILDQEEMIAEIARVLRKEGILLLSSPDRAVNEDAHGHNPYHVRELYQHELEELIGKYFGKYGVFGQRMVFASIFSGDGAGQMWQTPEHMDAEETLRTPKYNIIIATNAQELPKLPLSVMEGDLEEAESFTRKQKQLGELKGAYERLERSHSALTEQQQELWKEHKQLSDTHDELTQRQQELWNEYQALNKTAEERAIRIGELEGHLGSMEKHIGNLTGSLEESRKALFEKDVRLDTLERAVYDMEHSKSWRLTAPLRKTMGKVRELRKWFFFAPRRLKALARKRIEKAAAGQRKRIVLLSGEPATPGHIYRMERLGQALRPAYELSIMELAELKARREQLGDADIIWIWRAAPDDEALGILKHLHNSGAAIIFDVDDMCFHPEHYTVENMDALRKLDRSLFEVREYAAKMLRVAQLADLRIATTQPLMWELFVATRSPGAVLRNTFDHAYRLRCVEERHNFLQNKSDGYCRIGYAAGTATHQADLAKVAPALVAALKAHPNARLVLFNSLDLTEFPEFEEIRHQIEIRDVVPLMQAPAELARFDINIAPLEADNPFCNCKSELKFFEAALMRMPTIASPTSPFREAIENGVTGFIARTTEEWIDALGKLMDDETLRRQMGSAAQRAALWKFGPECLQVRSRDIARYLLAPPQEKSQLFQKLQKSENQPFRPVDMVDYDVIYGKGLPVADVSVVVPLYNYEKYVVEALDSLLNQGGDKFDVIIVNDYSTDNSEKVARNWCEAHADAFNSVSLLRNRRNSGLPVARNAGIDYSESELIMLLDADNLLLPGCIAECRRLLKTTDAAFAYPKLQTFGDVEYIFSDKNWDPLILRHGNYIDAMAMIRKACWAAVGGYAAVLASLGWEDYDLWCKFAEAGFWGINTESVLGKYRVHGGSMLHTTTESGNNRANVENALSGRHEWLQFGARK